MMYRSRSLTPTLFALGLSFALVGCAKPLRTARAPTGPALTVLSFNVNFGIAGDGPTLEAIAAAKADVVFLQETTPAWERALRARFAARYPHIAFHHSGGAGGLAILSRYAFEQRGTLPSPAGWFPAWRVILHTPLGKVQALNLHLRPPVSDSGSVVSGYFTTPKVRLAEISHYTPTLEAGLPTLIAGDLNENSSGRAVKFLRKQGFRSALPEFHPGARTWRWQTSVGRITHQLDHILYDKRLEPLDARVLRAGRSDHWPVRAVFQLRRERHRPGGSSLSLSPRAPSSL